MRAVVLIAGNFLREVRWYVVIMLLWVFGMAVMMAAFSERPSHDDILFIVRQEIVYGVALAMFMGAGTIHSDRRSRRILSLLSKAVERRDYLAGLLLGATVQSAVFFSGVALGAMLMGWRIGWSAGPVWKLVVPMIALSALFAAVALLCASFMHPLFATGLAGLVVAAQFRIEHAIGSGWLPLEAATRALLTFHRPDASAVPIEAVLAALLEAGAMWLLAGAVFARRDIAVAVD